MLTGSALPSGRLGGVGATPRVIFYAKRYYILTTSKIGGYARDRGQPLTPYYQKNYQF